MSQMHEEIVKPFYKIHRMVLTYSIIGTRNLAAGDVQGLIREHLNIPHEVRFCYYCGKIVEGRRWSFCCTKHTNAFYATVYWNMFKDRYLRNHPDCEYCGEKGKQTYINEADRKVVEKGVDVEVHHVVPILALQDLEIHGCPVDPDNVKTACQKCHVEQHRILNEKYGEERFLNKVYSKNHCLLEWMK